VSLFRSSLRPPAVLSDEAVERYVAALRADVDPDPAFRRRLRGVVLNRYVATREAALAGLIPPKMGRLGRAVLYASFTLGVSVTGVMAASEAAVPGDVLYPLKRAIEEMRVEVLPAAFHDELVVHELNERIAELATLAERGDASRVEALAAEVAVEYAAVIAGTAMDGEALGGRAGVFASLLAELPDDTRLVIDRAIGSQGTFGVPDDPADGTSAGGEQPGAGSGGEGGGTGGNGHANGAGNGNGGSGGGQGNGNAGSNSGNGSGSEQENRGKGNDREADDGEEAGTTTPTASPEPSPTPKPKKSPTP
jgi:hypothetical protein